MAQSSIPAADGITGCQIFRVLYAQTELLNSKEASFMKFAKRDHITECEQLLHKHQRWGPQKWGKRDSSNTQTVNVLLLR